jgi:hypothetical protein
MNEMSQRSKRFALRSARQHTEHVETSGPAPARALVLRGKETQKQPANSGNPAHHSIMAIWAIWTIELSTICCYGRCDTGRM